MDAITFWKLYSCRLSMERYKKQNQWQTCSQSVIKFCSCSLSSKLSLFSSVENAETIGTRMFPVSFQLILSGEISRTRKSSGANPEKRSPSRFQFPISDPFLSFFRRERERDRGDKVSVRIEICEAFFAWRLCIIMRGKRAFA